MSCIFLILHFSRQQHFQRVLFISNSKIKIFINFNEKDSILLHRKKLPVSLIVLFNNWKHIVWPRKSLIWRYFNIKNFFWSDPFRCNKQILSFHHYFICSSNSVQLLSWFHLTSLVTQACLSNNFHKFKVVFVYDQKLRYLWIDWVVFLFNRFISMSVVSYVWKLVALTWLARDWQ